MEDKTFVGFRVEMIQRMFEMHREVSDTQAKCISLLTKRIELLEQEVCWLEKDIQRIEGPIKIEDPNG